MPRPNSHFSSLHTLSQPFRVTGEWPSDVSRRSHGRPPVALDFASEDCLGLSGFSALLPVKGADADRHGLTQSDSAISPPGPDLTRVLEHRLARFVNLPVATTFASGAAAMRFTLRGLIRQGDRVIVDAGCHRAMFETFSTTRAQLLRCPPGSVDAVERRLARLSGQPRTGQIYIAVPAIAELTSTMADLDVLTKLAAHYRAKLIVDVSHDLGAMAQGGRGVMEVQGCLGQPDIVLGSLAPCFGAPGGFAAFRDPALKERLRASPWPTAPLLPALAARILAAFDIIDSAEGCRRRSRLQGASLRLRNHLMADGFRVLGHPSGIVPVRLPPLTAVACGALIASAGMVVPLLRAPVVAGHAPRWLVRLNANHGPADIDDLAELIREVSRTVDRTSDRTSPSPHPAQGRVEAMPQP